MEIHKSENGYSNVIKHFFIKNSKVLTVSIILCIGILVILSYCSSRNFNNSAYGTLQFSQGIDSGICANNLLQEQKLANAKKITASRKNIYVALAALELAQSCVYKNKLDEAVVLLLQGISLVKEDNLKSLISLRLARIQIQQKKADEALKTLDSIKGESFNALVADLRGEALLSKGDNYGACIAWESGIKSNTSPAFGKYIQMKINSLSI